MDQILREEEKKVLDYFKQSQTSLKRHNTFFPLNGKIAFVAYKYGPLLNDGDYGNGELFLKAVRSQNDEFDFCEDVGLSMHELESLLFACYFSYSSELMIVPKLLDDLWLSYSVVSQNWPPIRINLANVAPVNGRRALEVYVKMLQEEKEKLRKDANEKIDLSSSLEDWYMLFKNQPYYNANIHYLDWKNETSEKQKEEKSELQIALDRVDEFFNQKESEREGVIIANQNEQALLLIKSSIKFDEIFEKTIDQFLDVLYLSGEEEIPMIDLQGVNLEALIKALMVKYDYVDIDGEVWIIRNTKPDKGKFIYLSPQSIFANPDFDYIDRICKKKMEELEEEMGIKELSLEDLYQDFILNPRPKMKVIHLN